MRGDLGATIRSFDYAAVFASVPKPPNGTEWIYDAGFNGSHAEVRMGGGGA